ncbi:MAG TPA: alpha/beta hydrolase family protein [Pyrinomonadaceae bacterium]|jgi:S-formylglutathione hydrolase FrmB
MKRLRLALLLLVLLAALGALYYEYAGRVRVETVRMRSALLGREVSYRVVLPPGYGLVTSRAKRYPVLYLLHGWGGDYESWLTHTSVAGYASAHQLIVVTPEGGKGWYTDAPGGEPYESHLLRELLPDVDLRFRTNPNRRGRGVAGYSMGGYGALKLGFKHPELFGFAGSTSGALDAASRADEESLVRVFGEPNSAARFENDLPRLAREFPEERRGALPFLYLDCGLGDDWLGVNRAFAATLTERRIAHEYRQRPGAHVWPYWDEQAREILRVASDALAAPE